jgi:hypothetical protein
MTTARTAMHYLVMAAFVCATSQSALAQSTTKTSTASTAKVTQVAAAKPAPAPSKPTKPTKPPATPVAKNCLEVYNGVGSKATMLVSASATPAQPAPTLSSQDLKNANIQAALRATLLKVALAALAKLPPGNACNAIIAKIDAKFSRS